MEIALGVLLMKAGHHLKFLSLRVIQVHFCSICKVVSAFLARVTQLLSDATNIGDHGLDLEN
jgi:hypothetical protein